MNGQEAWNFFHNSPYLDGRFWSFSWQKYDFEPPSLVRYFLAFSDSTLCGLARVSYQPDYLLRIGHFTTLNPWKISLISVDVKFQSQGCASQIMDSLFIWAREENNLLFVEKFTSKGFQILKKALLRRSNKFEVQFWDTNQII